MEIILRSLLGNIVVAASIGVVAIAVRKHVRPSVTHALWILVLLKLVTPPIFFAEIPRFANDRPVAELSESPVAESNEPTTVDAAVPKIDTESETSDPSNAAGEKINDDDLRSALVAAPEQETDDAARSRDVETRSTLLGDLASYWPAIWAAGAFGVLSLALLRSLRFRRLVATGAAPSRRISIILGDAARLFGLARCPAVIVVAAPIPPLLWGRFGKPCIVLPGSLIDKLDDDSLRTLLAHELAHYARKDHWVRYLEIFVAAAYWWLPILPLFRRELRRTEEECCDAWVVGVLPTDAQAYAHALLATVDFVADTPAALPIGVSGMGAFDMLKRRLTMILVGSSDYRLRARGRGLLFLLALLALPFAPAFAQEGESFPETRRFIRELEKKRDEAAENGRERVAESLSVEIKALKDFLAQKDGRARRTAARPDRRAVEERYLGGRTIERRDAVADPMVDEFRRVDRVDEMAKIEAEIQEREALVKAEIAERRAEVDAKIREREAVLHDQIEERRREMESKEKMLVDQIEDARRKAANLDAIDRDMVLRRVDLDRKLAAADTARARATDEMNVMEKRIADMTAELQAIEKALANAPSDELAAKHAEMAKDIETSRARLAEMRTSLEKQTVELAEQKKLLVDRAPTELGRAYRENAESARRMEQEIRLQQSKLREDAVRLENEALRLSERRKLEIDRLNAEQDRADNRRKYELDRLRAESERVKRDFEENRVRLRRDGERTPNRSSEERKTRESEIDGNRRRTRNPQGRGSSSGYRADSGQVNDPNSVDTRSDNSLLGSTSSVGGMSLGGGSSTGISGQVEITEAPATGSANSTWISSGAGGTAVGGMASSEGFIGGGTGMGGPISTTMPGGAGTSTTTSVGMGSSTTTWAQTGTEGSANSRSVLVLEDETGPSTTGGPGSSVGQSGQGVPVLKDIPIVGDLFKKNSGSTGSGQAGTTEKKAIDAEALKKKKAELEEAIKKLEAEIEAIGGEIPINR